MSNIIPEKQKRLLSKIFYLRNSSAFFVWLLLAVLLSNIALFTVYVFVHSQRTWQNKQLTHLEHLLELKKSINTEGKENLFIPLIEEMSRVRHLSYFELLNKINKLFADNKIIYKNLIMSTDEKEAYIKISINALANDKESVTNFVRSIEADDSLSGLDIDSLLSSLRPDKDSKITFKLNLYFK